MVLQPADTRKASMQYSESDPTILAFNGGISVRVISHAQRAFAFDVTFYLGHPQLVKVANQKPPVHFHPHQDEFVQVREGSLAIELRGRERILTPKDGEFCLPRWANHRLYPPPPASTDDRDGSSGSGVARFLLSAQDTPESCKLDLVFFQNWYAYQDEVVVHGKKLDLIKAMNMFDAGGSYLSLPEWVPFNARIAQGMGVLVGRWIGGLLEYQPFYREWTTDWQLACDRMRQSTFQRQIKDSMGLGFRDSS